MLATAALAASLDAFAPVVVHDADERFPLASAAAHAPIARSTDARPTVYARAVPSKRGGAWLQYWLFYAGQDQDRGIVRTGRHEGDWELVQYRVDDAGRGREAVYAQHQGGERCGSATVETRGGGPDAFAAAARSCQASCNRVNACDAPERGLTLALGAIPAALLLLVRRRYGRPRTTTGLDAPSG